MRVPWGESCHREYHVELSGRRVRCSGWHTAMWNLLTGEWDAVCCRKHHKRGLTKFKEGPSDE